MHSIECYNDQSVMSWEGCGRKRLWPILKYCPLITLEKLRVATKDLSHDCYGLEFEPRNFITGSKTAEHLTDTYHWFNVSMSVQHVSKHETSL
jgi:hypothetical protein